MQRWASPHHRGSFSLPTDRGTNLYSGRLRRNRLPVEQQVPGVPRIEISALTEEQMCKPGAVKLIYSQLTETKAILSANIVELQAERQRTEMAAFRANNSDLTCGVLKERLRSTGHRHSITRLIEFVITILIAYAIDFARSRSWPNFAVFLLMSAVLGFAILLVDRRGAEPNGG